MSSPRRSSPEPLPSLPPSPVEEDLGWRAPWSHSDNDDDSPRSDTAVNFQSSKGKEKYQPPLPTSYADGGRGEVSQWPDQGRGTEVYPPTTDEATETRRVQENLMLWEVAERQRRKSARETASSTATSLVVDVARRASALWSRSSSVDGGGKHRVLQTSEEDNVRLDDILASPSPSAAPSPSPSPGPSPDHHPVTGPYTLRAGDPFSDPVPGSSSSLFVNAESSTEIDAASPSAAETPTSAAAAPFLSSPSAVSHSGNRLSAKVVSAPAPLDLPKPRSPPPRTATPHAKRPPEPFPRTDEEEDDARPVRWWTEWLCGCSEGPDRGGEAQAGRTNPME